MTADLTPLQERRVSICLEIAALLARVRELRVELAGLGAVRSHTSKGVGTYAEGTTESGPDPSASTLETGAYSPSVNTGRE